MSGSKTVSRIGFITGVQKEAEILRKISGTQNSEIRCAGANSDRAYKLASDLAEDGCELLISFGVAGALDPSLFPGDLIAPDRVLAADSSLFETSVDQLKSHFGSRVDFKSGPIFGSKKLIATAAEKQSLHNSTAAIAVDMESLAVATAACDYELPFLVIRAISDLANQDLPTAVLQAIDDQGNTHMGAIILELIKKPQELPDLMKLAGNSSKAFATLRRVAALGFEI